ncbi:hypothetical protein BD770DRAFT_429710 [Pilaira anomala]|nr:hypothetical protein BD770DRAFT_429710 [Pilaira anomala]
MPRIVLYHVQEELLRKKKQDKMLNLPDDNEQQRRRPGGGVIRTGYSDTFINKVKIISAFSREVIFKAQLFVNYYIITNCLTTIPNEIFTKNFWYSICMLIFGNLSSQELQAKYSSVLNLAHAFDQYFQDYSLSIRPLAGLKEYSQCLSAALTPLYCKIIEEYEEYRVRCTQTAAQEIVEASEKISSTSLIFLQHTKSVLAAAQASVKVSEFVVSTAESVIVVGQDTSPHFPSDSKRTYVSLLAGSAMTFNVFTS